MCKKKIKQTQTNKFSWKQMEKAQIKQPQNKHKHIRKSNHLRALQSFISTYSGGIVSVL